MVKICVIGAGVVGMSSAVKLQEVLGNSVEITVCANEFLRQTTSDIAAGIFRVDQPWNSLDGYDGPRTNPIRDVAALSLERYYSLLNSDNASDIGIVALSGTDIFPSSRADFVPPYIEYLSHDRVRRVETTELYKRYPHLPLGCKAYDVDTVLVSPRTYLPWLTLQFVLAGGKMRKMNVESFDQLLPFYDVIINCAGVRAGALTPDTMLTSSRGQIYRLDLPEFERGLFLMLNLDRTPTYVYYTPDGVVLGGTKQSNDWSEEIRSEDKEIIFSNLKKYLPQYYPDNIQSRVISERVGLRPSRPTIRLEKEPRVYNGKQRWIVHNYGHGGSGISFSWGTACLLSEMVEDIIRKAPHNSKL